jgi:hypothetical protein
VRCAVRCALCAVHRGAFSGGQPAGRAALCRRAGSCAPLLAAGQGQAGCGTGPRGPAAGHHCCGRTAPRRAARRPGRSAARCAAAGGPWQGCRLAVAAMRNARCTPHPRWSRAAWAGGGPLQQVAVRLPSAVRLGRLPATPRVRRRPLPRPLGPHSLAVASSASPIRASGMALGALMLGTAARLRGGAGVSKQRPCAPVGGPRPLLPPPRRSERLRGAISARKRRPRPALGVGRPHLEPGLVAVLQRA